MSEIVVTLPGVTFSNSEANAGFTLSDVEGWWDTTDPRLANEGRPAADGDFDQDPIFLEPRYVTLSGLWEGLQESISGRALLSRLHAGGSKRLTVTADGVSLWSEAVLASKIAWDVDAGPGLAEWEFTLKCRDPRRYGPEQVLTTGLPQDGEGLAFVLAFPVDFGVPRDAGRITMTNSGDADSAPRMVVTGGLSGGFELVEVETGRIVRVERPLADGQSVHIDMATGSVLLDGQSDISGWVTRREWITVDPGEVCTVQIRALGVVTGTPTLTAFFAEAER